MHKHNKGHGREVTWFIRILDKQCNTFDKQRNKFTAVFKFIRYKPRPAHIMSLYNLYNLIHVLRDPQNEFVSPSS